MSFEYGESFCSHPNKLRRDAGDTRNQDREFEKSHCARLKEIRCMESKHQNDEMPLASSPSTHKIDANDPQDRNMPLASSQDSNDNNPMCQYPFL